MPTDAVREMSLIELKQTMKRYLRPKSGFTFMELIVVMALISLMLFITIPRVQDTLLSDNTKQVSRWLIAKVQGLKESAVRDQKQYVLHVSLDFNKMWTTNTAMSEDELQNASQNAFKLPGDIKLLDVEYPDNEKISVGQADINFYQKGYSDMVMLHIENSDYEQLSLAIEPFLPRAKLHNQYVGFEE